MKRTFYLIIVFIACVSYYSSCSSANKSKEKETNVNANITNEHLAVGKAIDNVTCKADSTQSYALYLPSNYSPEKKYPVVYLLDPHAKGALAVSKYKALADKYNYILAGSNNSKNGNSWEETQYITSKLFADVSTRLSINTSRVYLAGFSGGARIANTITMLNGAINSAICCGASAPLMNPTNVRSDYCILGIAGNSDFNYVEMKRYHMVDIAGHNLKHFLMTFDGKHEWPDENTMDKAFWWLELNDMRKNNIPKNDSLIAQHLSPLLNQLNDDIKTNKKAEAYFLCKEIINFYEGVSDIQVVYDRYAYLHTTPEINQALKQQERNWKEEDALKQYYLKAFQTQNIQWWKNDITSLNKKIKTEKDNEKILMYKRVLGFLSLASYMQTSNALKQKALPAADFFSTLYLIVDPQNGDAHYFSANVKILQDNTKQALQSLSDAVKYGFSDKDLLQSESAFDAIRNTKEFQRIVNSISK